MTYFRTLGTLLIFLVVSNSAFSMTVSKAKYICPIDGKEFEDLVEMSGYRSGMQLDLKPLGPIGAPSHIPQCPDNNFVLYKEEVEFTKADIKKLRKYILNENYQNLAKIHTRYFLAAKTMQFMEEDKYSIAHFFLRATWQVDDAKSKYKVYASHALDAFKSYLKDSMEDDEGWVTANILVLELYRRMGMFQEAYTFYENISSHKKFNQGDIINQVINVEQKLIQKKDDNPYEIPEEG